jgi:2-dehydropantoate 2-reductase
MTTNDRPRIAVFGAGLIGCYVGGRLAAAGADVTLIGRARTAAELAARGLRVTDLDGADITVPADRLTVTDDPAALGTAGLVLLTVKSPATAEAAAAIAAHAPATAPVVSFQNGVSNADTLRGLLPGRTVVAGMVPFNVASPAPGHYHRGTGGLIHADEVAAMQAAAPLFAAAGLTLALSADMAGVMWGKLVINLNNAVNALSGLPLADQIGTRDYRCSVALCQREALALLRQAGIRPAKVLPVPTALVPWLFSLPDGLYRALSARSAPRIDRHARSSMADDLAQGRRTEVDYLNGEVVALAARLGRRAPVNARIVELVRAAEAGAARWEAAPLLAELRRAS